jgi:hypothetical protein
MLLAILDRGEGTRSPEELRLQRALRVLELIGTAEAQRLLGAVAERAPDSDLGQEAHLALERLKKRRR